MISFSCDCGKPLRAADEHAGKRAKCGGCGKVVAIPGARPAAVQAAAAPATKPASRVAPPGPKARASAGPEEGQGTSHIYDLDEMEAPRSAPISRGRPCPGCNKPLPSPDAVLCVECGYNLKTGKKAVLEVAKPKRARKRRSSGVSTFIVGRLTSGKFVGGMASLIGGTVWLVAGLMINRIFFYPIFLILAGLVGAVAGLIDGDE